MRFWTYFSVMEVMMTMTYLGMMTKTPCWVGPSVAGKGERSGGVSPLKRQRTTRAWGASAGHQRKEVYPSCPPSLQSGHGVADRVTSINNVQARAPPGPACTVVRFRLGCLAGEGTRGGGGGLRWGCIW